MNKNCVIGIDMGGTKISTALADLNGRVLSKCTIPTNAIEGEEAVLARIISTIDRVMKEAGKAPVNVKAIGVGSPGPLDSKNGLILNTPNLPFENFNIVQPIENRYNVPTYLDNDANVAAIGEFMLGEGVGTQNMLYVTVSTGIGGGAILNGKIYRGHTSNALEVGHMTIVENGNKCNCGNYGCAEAHASGTAIGRQGREAVDRAEETSLKNYSNVTSYEVFKEAEKGDKVSKDILDKSLNYLGICVANLVAIFDPEVIVIGGGVSKGGQIVFDKIREVVDKRCFKSMAESCKIVPAGLGIEAGVLGAVALAIIESK